MQTLTAQTIRELKGCALSVLCLGIIDPQPHKAKWYKMMSGYANAAVTEALAYLTETGWMLKSPRGWIIATDQQLILSTDYQKLSTGYPQVDGSNHDEHDSMSLVVSSYIDSNNKEIIDLTTTTRENSNHEKHDSIKKICTELGIEEPALSEIASMDLTTDYIKAHVQADVDLPLAIWRIKHRRKAPKSKTKARSRYTNDKYADFLD